MPHREHPVTDFTISDEDEARYETGMKACAAHLADLKRAHDKPPPMVQPPSYGRFGLRPEPARFPARETLATVSGARE
jgi:hypothetical protein